ncbi:hypothetical protein [Paraflavitalea speifideaquila]|uniref:hypothetical protein n=1 Tax=Paraflavitalea speifideaquila TaxID=3076558 RepID=UPI0028EDD635|nr:hypothetical protein [Paraflavitalea speifideiaquila]
METFKQELIQMVIDLTTEVKTATYKVITVAPDEPAPTAKEQEEKPKKKQNPGNLKSSSNRRTAMPKMQGISTEEGQYSLWMRQLQGLWF